MPRSNRPRGRRPATEQEELDVAGLSMGWRRAETRRGFSWNVQPISAVQALKTYVCPGCSVDITPGVAHLVVWRADGVLGDAADIAGRRHWHVQCWKVG